MGSGSGSLDVEVLAELCQLLCCIVGVEEVNAPTNISAHGQLLVTSHKQTTLKHTGAVGARQHLIEVLAAAYMQQTSDTMHYAAAYQRLLPLEGRLVAQACWDAAYVQQSRRHSEPRSCATTPTCSRAASCICCMRVLCVCACPFCPGSMNSASMPSARSQRHSRPNMLSSRNLGCRQHRVGSVDSTVMRQKPTLQPNLHKSISPAVDGYWCRYTRRMPIYVYGFRLDHHLPLNVVPTSWPRDMPG